MYYFTSSLFHNTSVVKSSMVGFYSLFFHETALFIYVLHVETTLRKSRYVGKVKKERVGPKTRFPEESAIFLPPAICSVEGRK